MESREGRREPRLRYLSAAAVERLMPPVGERLALAERAMKALLADAELPPKLGVHPRPGGSFAHAMPTHLRGAPQDGSGDLLGLKWVTGCPDNAAAGLPQIHGTVLLSDPRSGLPAAVLDASAITAHRTAAVSGLCIGAWARLEKGVSPQVALLGAGAQARSHVPLLAHVTPGARLAVHDRHPERAEAVADLARASGAFEEVRTEATAASALVNAEIVLTMVSFGPTRQALSAAAFGPSCRLVVAVDYDMCVPAQLVGGAALFALDEVGQFLAARDDGLFREYRDPDTTIGQAGNGEVDGLVVATHLGVGVADLVFADAILRRAREQGIGIDLPR